MKAILVLEDSKVFQGQSFGVNNTERIGKLAFNTAVVGYQEMATDPANAGKLLILTYPLIGNYGTAPKFNESKKVWLEAMIIKEKTRIYSNWQAKESFEDFAKANNLLVLFGIDTRTLAVHIRQKGEMLGIISTECFNVKELSAKIESFRKKTLNSRLAEISVRKPDAKKAAGKQKKVAVLDLGITHSLLKQLHNLDFNVAVLPYNTKAEDILKLKPHYFIISNGPEEDPGLEAVVQNIKGVIGKAPILGINTGFQILAKALGAKISRLKLGHRGVNYPIHKPGSHKGEITVQNHGLVVDEDSLNKIKHIKITAYNLNDRTVEEIESKFLKLIGVQYDPVSPGFDEVNPVFHRLMKLSERSN